MLQGDALKYADFYADDYILNFIKKINKILDKSTNENKDFIEQYASLLDENKEQFYSVFNEKADYILLISKKR